MLMAALVLMMLPFLSNAQGLLDKMKEFAGEDDTLGRLEGRNYIIDGPGSVTFADGVVQEGIIQYFVTTNNYEMRYFYFTPANEMDSFKVTYKEVDHFTVKGKDFYPVRTKEDDISVGNAKIFMEMLNGSPTDKFKMYLLRKLEANTSGIGDRPYDVATGYYVILPEFKNAHEIIDIKFTPFAKKMSEYLKDCPELAEKIADKDKDYKVNMFKGAANNEIFLRVMNEYNNCK